MNPLHQTPDPWRSEATASAGNELICNMSDTAPSRPCPPQALHLQCLRGNELLHLSAQTQHKALESEARPRPNGCTQRGGSVPQITPSGLPAPLSLPLRGESESHSVQHNPVASLSPQQPLRRTSIWADTPTPLHTQSHGPFTRAQLHLATSPHRVTWNSLPSGIRCGNIRYTHPLCY